MSVMKRYAVSLPYEGLSNQHIIDAPDPEKAARAYLEAALRDEAGSTCCASQALYNASSISCLELPALTQTRGLRKWREMEGFEFDLRTIMPAFKDLAQERYLSAQRDYDECEL